MTMVNSGLKGLMLGQRRRRWAINKQILVHNVDLMFVQRHGRWANNKPTLAQHLVFAGRSLSQCWTDVGPES